MDKKEKEGLEENYMEVLKEAQQKLPNIILPSMGILDNEVKIDIEVNNFFETKEK